MCLRVLLGSENCKTFMPRVLAYTSLIPLMLLTDVTPLVSSRVAGMGLGNEPLTPTVLGAGVPPLPIVILGSGNGMTFMYQYATYICA